MLQTSVVATKVTMMVMAMAVGNAACRYHGTWRRLPWSLRLIADDADGGNSGVQNVDNYS